ncbi:MAG: helix-turn-helix domain-containing protein [Candidatus Margulisbacteria bacterium]|jgi:transcriptional regulator with XRE-family HTH domain|nr:helix-turn-helix domain-containing protein [Candidatus Margulisiibacteriota bacterium]
MDKEITNEDLKKLLSKKLELLRKDSGQTLEATADSLDMDLSEYFRLLKGQRLPHLRNLLRLNKKYGVSLDWWFNELEEIPANPEQTRNKNTAAQIASLLQKLEPGLQEAVLAMLKTFVKKLSRGEL